MRADRFGTGLESGDEFIVDQEFAAFSRCKDETGWIVSHFIEHETTTEVIAVHKVHGESASFPLRSTTKKPDIKHFLNSIAPSSRSTTNG